MISHKRLVVAKGWGKESSGNKGEWMLANGHKISSWEEKNAKKLDCGDGYTTSQID